MRLGKIALLIVPAICFAVPVQDMVETNPGDRLELAMTYNEGPGAKDWSGKGKNATANTAAYKPDDGQIGGVYEYSGAEYMDLPTFDIFNGTNSFTISVWLNADSLSRNQRAVNLRGRHVLILHRFGNDGTPQNSYHVRVHQAGSWRTLLLSSTLSVNTYYHIVITYNSTDGWKTYLDGKLDRTSAQTGYILVSPSVNVIGSNEGHSGEFFDGTIDEVLIYSRELSLAEIKDLYEQGKAEGK